MAQAGLLRRIRLKRIYAPAAPEDGTRVLVDRLWPRGIRKADAAIDRWDKEVAPSPALRTWFAHDPARWEEFRRRYGAELAERPAEVSELLALARAGPVTLLYGARDLEHNHALVLRDLLVQDRSGVGSGK